jgi:hypothetical protein
MLLINEDAPKSEQQQSPAQHLSRPGNADSREVFSPNSVARQSKKDNSFAERQQEMD